MKMKLHHINLFLSGANAGVAMVLLFSEKPFGFLLISLIAAHGFYWYRRGESHNTK